MLSGEIALKNTHYYVHCRYYTDAQFNDCDDICSGMSIFGINSRSMHRNFSELHDYLNSFIRKFDIICLSETWLNASDNLDLFQLFGYKMVHRYPTNKKGGGVAIYISNNFNYKVLD